MTAESEGSEAQAQQSDNAPPPEKSPPFRSWIKFDIGLRNQTPASETREEST
jgi:hypothetical protein